LADLIFISLIVLTAILLYKKRQFKYFKLFIYFSAWFFIGVAIHLQIIPLDRKIAERWMYFPIVGLIGMAGTMLETLVMDLKNIRIVTTVLILIIVVLSARTFMRSFDWRNDMTLGVHDISNAKNVYDLENIISVGLTRQGKLQEAKYHAAKSVRLYPAVTNLTNLGAIYAILGDYKDAKIAYVEALKYDNYYLTYQNLGSLALVYGDIRENTAFLIGAVKKFPYNAKLWLCLALLEYREGNTGAAKKAIGNAWHLMPDNGDTYFYNEIMNNRPVDIKLN